MNEIAIKVKGRMKIIAYFDSEQNAIENRIFYLSATNKLTYICTAINKTEPVDIISPSWTLNRSGYYCGKKYKLLERTTVTLLPTFGVRTAIGRRLRRIFSLIMLTLYLFRNVKSGEKLLVYHSISLYKPLKILQRYKKIMITLEVEEIYQNVQLLSKSLSNNEYKFFELADGYIFPTTLLNEKINLLGKPYAIIHGSYQVEPDRSCKINDGKIHCVYAGTFDPRKGAAAAAAAAACLDKNYHIHILGFGSEEDTKKMQNLIAEISKQTECTLTYDGLLSGEDYIRFIQSCDIGLSTQNPNADFNETSFPSKVLSYLANGLSIVSIRIKALETSVVDDLLYYYNEDTPQAIAGAIRSVDLNKVYDSRKRIAKLDAQFVKDIEKVLR